MKSDNVVAAFVLLCLSKTKERQERKVSRLVTSKMMVASDCETRVQASHPVMTFKSFKITIHHDSIVFKNVLHKCEDIGFFLQERYVFFTKVPTV